jgi:hypothetical protein
MGDDARSKDGTTSVPPGKSADAARRARARRVRYVSVSAHSVSFSSMAERPERRGAPKIVYAE